ncbi:MAG: hypothetical protein JXA46_15545 [Dehalococcoidales bacterium]|nr:hypothetical protein [Dehalococcoidales bacterium]
MKMSKLILLVLLPFLILTLVLPALVAAQYGGKEEVIEQVLEVTTEQLSGYREIGDQPDGSYIQRYCSCDTECCQGEVQYFKDDSFWEYKLEICRWDTESKATAYLVTQLESYLSSTTFHEYPAGIWTTSEQGQPSVLMWQSDKFVFYIDATNKPVKAAAEILYANAVNYGLITSAQETVAQDSDGDGVPDDIDQCSGTPPGTPVDATGCPLATGIGIAVSLDGQDYGPGEVIKVKVDACDGATGDPIQGASVQLEVKGPQGVIQPGIATPFGPSTDALGDYKADVFLPDGIAEGTYTLRAIVSAAGYPQAIRSVQFNVGLLGLQVVVSTASGKTQFEPGDTTYFTVTVFEAKPSGNAVDDAVLSINAPGAPSSMTTNPNGEYSWSHTWTEQERGTWQVDVKASKPGYSDGQDTISIVIGGLQIVVTTDKANYILGDEIYITCQVNSPEADERDTDVEILIYDSDSTLLDRYQAPENKEGIYQHSYPIRGEVCATQWTIVAMARKIGYGALEAKTLVSINDSIDLKATMKVKQNLTPPMMSTLVPHLGKADVRIELKISGENKKYEVDLSNIPVRFWIDSPSKLSPEQTLTAKGGHAKATVDFHPDEDGKIFAYAEYPARLNVSPDQTTAPSDELATEKVLLRSICDQYNTGMYENKPVSDIALSTEELKSQFAQAVEEYGENRVSASHHLEPTLLSFLANPGTECSVTYYTGKETALRDYVEAADSGKGKITPGDLFKRSLQLNDGDMTDALLTCHNLLRAAARGGEDLPLTPDEQQILDKGYDKFDRDQFDKWQTVRSKTGRYADEETFSKLAPLRSNDNEGAWYHLFGTATLALNSQSSYIKWDSLEMLPNIPIHQIKNRGIVEIEEGMVSGDKWADPPEYCIDNFGLEIGDLLRQKSRQASESRVEERIRLSVPLDQWKLEGRNTMAIRMACPTSITVTNVDTGEYFELQQGKTPDGSLPCRFILVPEDDTFGLLLIVESGDYDIDMEAAEDGTTSVYVYDFASRTGADYADFTVQSGDTIGLPIHSGNVGEPMTKSDHSQIYPVIDQLSEQEEKEIRQQVEEKYAANAENQPPVASFFTLPETPVTGDYIALVSTSSDPDGERLIHSWYLDRQYILQAADSMNWGIENLPPGQHTIKLVVEDFDGASDECAVLISLAKAGGLLGKLKGLIDSPAKAIQGIDLKLPVVNIIIGKDKITITIEGDEDAVTRIEIEFP